MENIVTDFITCNESNIYIELTMTYVCFVFNVVKETRSQPSTATDHRGGETDEGLTSGKEKNGWWVAIKQLSIRSFV